MEIVHVQVKISQSFLESIKNTDFNFRKLFDQFIGFV
nr:MAG TPA: hypothetical protein [Caudoviricetes sp.]